MIIGQCECVSNHAYKLNVLAEEAFSSGVLPGY